jgi:hypothetical protein
VSASERNAPEHDPSHAPHAAGHRHPAFLGGRAVQGSGDLDTALPDGAITPAGLQQGVLLYPDEVNQILTRTAEINARIEEISGDDAVPGGP